MVAHAQSRRMRKVVKAALPLLARRGYGSGWTGRNGLQWRWLWRRRCGHLAGIAIWLLHAESTWPRIPGIGEHITHVVEEHKAQGIAKEGKYRRRQPHLGAVHQRARASNRKSRFRIAGPRGIDGESAVRRGTAGIETLGQRNQRV